MKTVKEQWQISIDYWFDTHCPYCFELIQSEALDIGGIDGNEKIDIIVTCSNCDKKFKLNVPMSRS